VSLLLIVDLNRMLHYHLSQMKVMIITKLGSCVCHVYLRLLQCLLQNCELLLVLLLGVGDDPLQPLI
jgi:hypothetical protein